MSAKDVPKHQKSKKNSYFHSQRKEDQFDESLSTLSNHIEHLKNERKRLNLELEIAQNCIEQFTQKMNKYMGLKSKVLKEAGKKAEGELQMWQQTYTQINIKLQAVDEKLRQFLVTPEKARKKKNYVLKKVQQPPSDNE